MPVYPVELVGLSAVVVVVMIGDAVGGVLICCPCP